jgi:hypothetical protein
MKDVWLSPRVHRLANTVFLVLLAWGIAALGRYALDWMESLWPQWKGFIERFGGRGLGFLVVIVVLIPLFRLWGITPRKH